MWTILCCFAFCRAFSTTTHWYYKNRIDSNRPERLVRRCQSERKNHRVTILWYPIIRKHSKFEICAKGQCIGILQTPNECNGQIKLNGEQMCLNENCGCYKRHAQRKNTRPWKMQMQREKWRKLRSADSVYSFTVVQRAWYATSLLSYTHIADIRSRDMHILYSLLYCIIGVFISHSLLPDRKYSVRFYAIHDKRIGQRSRLRAMSSLDWL